LLEFLLRHCARLARRIGGVSETPPIAFARAASATATANRTGKPLIESDRVEGTTVYDPQGNNLGSIKRLMIDKISGTVSYAVISFGGFLGIGAEEHAVPWNKLTYDERRGGYRTDITEQELRGAPTLARDPDWNEPPHIS